MRTSIAIILLAVACTIHAQVYTGLVGVQGGGLDRVLDVAYAANGDRIVEGCFNGPVVFGDTTLVADISGDTFVGRLDSTGNWLWARNTGGQQSYGGQLILDDGGAIYALVGAYRLVKLNDSGDVLWTFEQQGLQLRGMGLLNDDVLLVGAFNFTAIFGTDTFSTTNFYTDGFLGRLSGSTGTWEQAWHLRGNGFSDAEIAWGVAATPQGEILFTMESESPAVYVGDDTLVAPTSSDQMYVVEMDTTGHVNWWAASTAGAAGPPTHIRFTAAGDPILLGRFYSFNFDYDGVVYPPPVLSSSDDAYVMWLGAGGALQNIVFLCGPGDQQGLDLEQDAAGDLYIAGVTCGMMTLGGTTLNDPAICNAFVAVMDASGTWQWAVDLAGPGNSSGYGVAVAPDGTVCMGGLFNTAVVNAGPYSLTPAGADDGFITTIGPIATVIAEVASMIPRLAPNPAHGSVRLDAPSPVDHVRLWDTHGRLVRSWEPTQVPVQLSLAGLTPGLYMVQVEGANGLHCVRLCVE